jgi:Putative zinc dependent peptidase (DUF5700)
MRLVAAVFLVLSAAPSMAAPSGAGTPVLQVRVVTDEADAALAILEEHARTGAVGPASWDRLWKSEGFVRLKKRQESFGAKDVEKDFRDFLTSAEPLSHVHELRQALETWKHLDATAAARRAGAYLPPGIPLRATIYPVIKKQKNSFVFELSSSPAMFMYVDPQKGPAKLENTLAHELHHVGLAGCPKPPDYERLSAAQKTVFDDLGGFGEGLAVLAAAGGPDVHPHATDDPAAWLVWERDVANFNTDLRRLEAFFRDLLTGRLTEEEANRKLFSFIDAEGVPQGPFYTVGWKMAAMVERARGRNALVKLLCDPRALLAAYNEVAAGHPRSDGEGLATWSPDFLAGLTPAAPSAAPAPH